MDALTDFRNDRAFNEDYDAYIAKMEHHSPARFGVFSGKWVEGWEGAAVNEVNFQVLKKAQAVQLPQ